MAQSPARSRSWFPSRRGKVLYVKAPISPERTLLSLFHAPRRTPSLVAYTRHMSRQGAAARPRFAIAAVVATLLAGFLL